MIARVADHCFWLGRYLERVDCTARVLHVTLHLSLDAELGPRQCWLPVVIVSGEREAFFAKHGEAAAGDAEIVQSYMTWDETNDVSLVRSIAAARDNARSIREVVSLEVWETLNELYLWSQSPAARDEYTTNRYAFYRTIRRAIELCRGLLQSTMLHDDPLDFLLLGLLLERAGHSARIVDVHHHALSKGETRLEVVETGVWLSILRSCSGKEPFMKRHQGRVTGPAVAAFLILEPLFPRSVQHAVAEAHMRLLSIRPAGANDLPGERSLARLRALDAWLASQTAETILPIHDLATYVVSETAGICEEIGRELLGYGAQVAEGDPEPQALNGYGGGSAA
ncbi:alpha-E domain-containing protein [Polyangium sp. y55x31]|uniref:alpha-E domain-containing protein n=1 Tax=Polyangium sp. y55x31 TaxID=3042688 RepID=UPI0024830AE6|nr:alpha-E domain-containing protein [Polyangium sp. y55x31]MDI1479025.1 alpha-E domain-containing protein [Polyangium sp. y55x31]